ncbi:MAG TPA: hypothetical protein VHA56_12840, partial [Mucilaginibacter sp.]|nr:hypothetical protein [Mucilaginibacter sp.]
KANSEWKSLINGSAEGVLFGGNIDTLNFLCGTRYLMPPKDDTIFFIELNGMSLAAIDRALEQLLQSGIFATTRGIIVGKFHAYDFSSSGHIKETQENHFIEIDKMILEKFSCLNVPIVSRVDCGHTDPMLTLPIGIKAKIINAEISILESAIV